MTTTIKKELFRSRLRVFYSDRTYVFVSDGQQYSWRNDEGILRFGISNSLIGVEEQQAFEAYVAELICGE